MTDTIGIGTRVRITQELWRYPHFIVEKGATGTVVNADDELWSVRMDETIPGAEEWDNEVHWYPNNCDDDPLPDLEILTVSVN